ncbi:MAG: hypothetical protein ACP5UN_00645 [Candidatus Micrarchaeia archaeon]
MKNYRILLFSILMTLFVYSSFIPAINSQSTQNRYGTSQIILNKTSITLALNKTTTVNFKVLLTSGQAWGTTVKIINNQNLSNNGIGVSLLNNYNQTPFSGTILISLIPICNSFTCIYASPGKYKIILAAVNGDVSPNSTALILNVVSNSINVSNSTNTTAPISTTINNIAANTSISSNSSKSTSLNTSKANSIATSPSSKNSSNLYLVLIVIIIIIIIAVIALKYLKSGAKNNNKITSNDNQDHSNADNTSSIESGAESGASSAVGNTTNMNADTNINFEKTEENKSGSETAAINNKSTDNKTADKGAINNKKGAKTNKIKKKGKFSNNKK